MIGKTKIIFSLLIVSFILLGVMQNVSACDPCVPQSYDSGWLDIVPYVTDYSGSAGLYDGNYFVDDNTGIVTIGTQSLPFSGTYTFYVKYGIGTGNDLTTEDFQVVCGGTTHTFLDSILIDDPQTLIDSMSCTFTSGSNSVDFKSINTGSVHLYKFKIIGEKTCPPVVSCGDGIVNQVSEQCDLGILNGNVCNPFYGQTCNWCNAQCQSVTETGSYCGDGTCDSQENCNTCSQDCGVCPPGPTCPLNPSNYDYLININGRLRADQTLSSAVSSIIPLSLSPGEYTVTLVAYDEYVGRTSVSQANEQYALSFIKNSVEVALTPAHSDLADYVLSDMVVEIVTSSLSLSSGADSIQAKHIAYPSPGEPNSVEAVCVGITKNDVPPTPTCGDGIVNQVSEQCDLGILNGNVCNPFYGQTCNWCNAQCQSVTETGSYCGDGTCDSQENCNTCSQDCGTCPPVQVCGNGIREGNEECDDGNTNSGDGCSSTCKDEDDDRVIKTPLVINTCNPNWECSGWSECSGGIMVRNCVDKNNCEIQYNEPHETTACDITAQVKEQPKSTFLWFLLGILLLIVLLIILINLLRY